MSQLPPDSALGALYRKGRPHWTLTDHLLDDLRMALTSTKKRPAKPHSTRPKPRKRTRNLNSPAFRAARKRAEERRRALAADDQS